MPHAGDRGWGPPGGQQIMTVVLSNGVKIPVAERLAPLVRHLGNETLRRGYTIKPGQTWGYCLRKVRGGTSWSNHSWGVAIDINSLPPNHMRKLPLNVARSEYTDHPEWMVQLWKQHGFGWGGDYRKVKDAMHYEFLGTPAQADALVRKLTATAPSTTSELDLERVYRRGDRGGNIPGIQKVLAGAGLYSGAIDGVYGPGTEAGVRAWQQRLGLTADGKWGPATQRKTDEVLRALAGS